MIGEETPVNEEPQESDAPSDWGSETERLDIDRLAEHLRLSPDEFIEFYLEPAKDGRYRIRGKPCPFLGGDSRCTVYAVRPDCCREYPHTDKEGFSFRTHMHAENTKHCPAVFWIVEELRVRATGEAG